VTVQSSENMTDIQKIEGHLMEEVVLLFRQKSGGPPIAPRSQPPWCFD